MALCAPAIAGPGLAKIDAQRLAAHRAAEREGVNLAILSRKGGNADTAAEIGVLRGVVHFRFDEADYLSASLPVDAALAVAKLDYVEAVAIDQVTYVLQTASTATAAPAGPSIRPPLHAPIPFENPYPFLRDLGADDFRASAPHHDGRGVIIAHVEDFPDFLSPELQGALDGDGRSVPKFRAVVNQRDLFPSLEVGADQIGANDWQWVRLSEPLDGRSGEVENGGRQFRVPAKADYRVGWLSVPATHLDQLKLRVDRPQIEGPIALLWSDQEGAVRLDFDGDGDFTDEATVEDFSRSRSFGSLGQDDPATPIRESMGFAVHQQDGYLNFAFGRSSHATMVAGIAAARAGDKGRVEGVAPGAQFVTIYGGQGATTFAQALIVAFSGPSDVILIETNSNIISEYRLLDGASAFDLLIDRLTERYDKLALITAGNSAGLSAVRDPTPAGAVVVGAAQSHGATLAHFGLNMSEPFDLHWLTTEGPSGIGGMKPDLLAPVNFLAPDLGFEKGTLRAGYYELPPGYQIAQGTSSAAPVAAGAAALLIGAAKKAGIPHGADALKRALLDSASFVPGVSAHQQGTGVIRVGEAWKRLQELANSPAQVELKINAPVRTATSSRLDPPNQGVGLFEVEGWRVGEWGKRTVTVKRRGGSEEALRVELHWRGNADNVFGAPATVLLREGKEVEIPIGIMPKQVGASSAILEFRRSGTGEIIQRMLCTVVVPYEFEEAGEFTVSDTVSVGRPGRDNLFFRVPPDAQAISFRLRHEQGTAAADLFSPENVRLRTRIAVNPASGEGQATIANPTPGVWQLIISEDIDRWRFEPAAHQRPPDPVNVEVTSFLSRADVSLSPNTATARNHAAPFNGRLQTTSLGALRRIDGRIAGGGQQIFEVDTVAGDELLIIQADASGDSQADIDLYLFRCANDTCAGQPKRPFRRSFSHGARERIIVDRPEAGRWRAVVDASSHVGSVAFQYFDVVTSPRYGSFVTSDVLAAHPTGDTWSSAWNAWRTAETEPGRVPALASFVRAPDLNELDEPRLIVRETPFLSFDETVVPLGLIVRELNPESGEDE